VQIQGCFCVQLGQYAWRFVRDFNVMVLQQTR
jgi:hypothetical protein